ncbi:MAG: lysine--tRNA ligase [Candidatus Taylorbacteria bacterium RIFCSPHIGHO2_01_FULL_43_120]|nr:MAG: lysine--tRNA ligase [Candidatus Taylorbacteria bacterium RIFCSPHIGHO2_01_FULL_43_120]OHA28948.1 MAG: lysine--tRNA ligase [Candidatus Taylorbacteria bacterium RIFCSPHIGHO2_12_FULL_42_34]OHA37750.1 MAG: lysine--tRNA ligase [Candidatus Taylorbacteria bacterium RIFCSPLOWO2_02_FULL_43_22b]
MASIEEIRKTRLEKLEYLKSQGIQPYPSSTERNTSNIKAIDDFDKLAGKEIILAGRIMSERAQGGLVFFNIYDGTSSFQALIKKDEIEEASFDLFIKTADIGDFVEIKGDLFLTKREEKTLKVKEWKMLAKSLMPLPEKWHGLKDVEERFRKRYLDILSSPDVRRRFEIRSLMVKRIREFYDRAGYMEVETPVLQPLAGGATALPFKTRHNALETDFYLTIAQELYLKKLIVAGFNKVYEIGRKFRNEGIDVTHNPEFTMLESNEAYADAAGQMKFIEELFREVTRNVIGKPEVVYGGNTVNFDKPFAVKTFFGLIREHSGLNNPEQASDDELKAEALNMGVKMENRNTRQAFLDGIYKKAVRPKLIQPTFIIDYPVEFNPFAKRKHDNPSLIDRFQLIAGGLELVNAFSELNNPIDQKERYEDEERKKREGEPEISPSDADYLEAMEHGMPPNGGIGIGLDRFAMLLTDVKNIKEVILFPTLKPKG